MLQQIKSFLKNTKTKTGHVAEDSRLALNCDIQEADLVLKTFPSTLVRSRSYMVQNQEVYILSVHNIVTYIGNKSILLPEDDFVQYKGGE